MVMHSVLEDSRLVQLQQEGGARLSWLRSVIAGEEEQEAVEKVSTLYNQVDELLHSLVTLSNCRTQELSFIQDFSRLEQALSEVSQHSLSAAQGLLWVICPAASRPSCWSTAHC